MLSPISNAITMSDKISTVIDGGIMEWVGGALICGDAPCGGICGGVFGGGMLLPIIGGLADSIFPSPKSDRIRFTPSKYSINIHRDKNSAMIEQAYAVYLLEKNRRGISRHLLIRYANPTTAHSAHMMCIAVQFLFVLSVNRSGAIITKAHSRIIAVNSKLYIVLSLTTLQMYLFSANNVANIENYSPQYFGSGHEF